jgi:hypothetical protein
MKIISSLAVVLAGAMLVVPQAADAHHSFAMFDRTQKGEKVGVVKEVRWTNPHVWIYILTPDDKGVPEEWGFETGPTNTLVRSGWKRDTIKTGDKVTIDYLPMKNGTHAGSMTLLTREDGTTMDLAVQGAKPEEGEKPQ